MVTQARNLWRLVLDHQYIAPDELAEAIQHQLEHQPLDFRTRLLVRDGCNALEKVWGSGRLHEWLGRSQYRRALEAIRNEDLGQPGFPFLEEQLVEPTRPESIRAFFRELSGHIHKPVTIFVGGSGSPILTLHLQRATQDIDVVNEVPEEIRSLHKQLRDLQSRYRLQVSHFQGHYLPAGWETRAHALEPFGKLQVCLVDVLDVFLSKLFSRREKDRDDLRVLAPQLARDEIERRLRDHCGELAADPALRQNAVDNWFILYGDALPT